ncbi:hypothetical protein OH799_31945 [Nocardia sp. NBC_00881]|uniref:hypothetical protein n=1 Tax=Nocardia sp. NBC_00881 TaxID=2975995 RepID=UPI00386FFC92|nr:hypothetical protein OH799_31945 [Nocardia sp. NBC_00881]
MRERLAVVFIHGVEINDAHFADTAIALLKRSFARFSGVYPDDALVIRPAFWAPVLQTGQDELLDRVGGAGAIEYFRALNRLGTRAAAGSTAALVTMAASGLIRWLPCARDFHFPTLRWLAVHYIGDAVAYQINSTERAMYDEVHAVVANTLGELAEVAGPTAPLCVISHSLGTVIASNFFYDLEVEHGFYPDEEETERPRSLVGPRTREFLDGGTSLERGETLTFLYTLGSPLALWAGRLPDRGRPVLVPHPNAADHNPGIGGEWVNVYDPDDVIASPLKRLNGLYGEQVTADRRVSVGPRWMGWTPLAHPWYWNDRRVIDPIGRSLARAWAALGNT